LGPREGEQHLIEFKLRVNVVGMEGKLVEFPFFIATLPVKLPADFHIDPRSDKSNEAIWGKWMCSSLYFGKGGVGKYLWKDIVLPQCTVEQRWAGTCGRQDSVLIRNPMAYFFDMDSNEPFLVLWAFDPWFSKNDSGVGLLDSPYPYSTYHEAGWELKKK
jgi:hypothetical protein